MQGNEKMFESFGNLLDQLREGERYESLPPRASPEDDNAPFVNNDELDALDQDDFGERKRNDAKEVEADNRPIRVVENLKRIKIDLPEADQIAGINIVGISGDNKRVLTPSFHMVLARSAIVDFKYTKGYEKPYFYTKSRSVSSILVIDNNIFEDDYKIYTYNEVANKGTNKFPILPHIRKFTGKPIRFRYKHDDTLMSSPNSHSLGLAVKLQHTLELDTINDINFDDNNLTICVKDGPYLSNSMVESDAIEGLQRLISWSGKKRFFVAVSNKISDSRVLINTIKAGNEYLLEEYFKGQGVTTSIIESFGTDLLLLRKILPPGFRTPLIHYVEKTRAPLFADDVMKGLHPLTCYYHKFNRPYNFIRIEIPKFMWEENRELTEFTIAVAIWQHELGSEMPLVTKAAAEQADLTHEKYVIEQQMLAAFEKKKLGLVEFLNIK